MAHKYAVLLAPLEVTISLLLLLCTIVIYFSNISTSLYTTVPRIVPVTNAENAEQFVKQTTTYLCFICGSTFCALGCYV